MPTAQQMMDVIITLDAMLKELIDKENENSESFDIRCNGSDENGTNVCFYEFSARHI